MTTPLIRDKMKGQLFTSITKIQEDEEAGGIYIEGFANTTSKDRADDIILASAWENASALENFRKNPIMLFNHNYNEPCGTFLEVEPRDNGLWVRGFVSSAAEKVYRLVKEGILKTFSVGFRIPNHDAIQYNEADDAWLIGALELHEISIVAVPCNQDSTFSVAKSLGYTQSELKNLKGISEEPNEPTIIHEEKQMENNQLQEMMSQILANQEAVKAAEEANAREAEAKARAEAKEKALVESVSKRVSAEAAQVVAELQSAITEGEAKFAETVERYDETIASLKDEIKSMTSTPAFAGGHTPIADAVSGRVPTAAQKELDLLYMAGVVKGTDMKNLKSYQKAVNSIGNIEVSSDAYETIFSTNLMRDIEAELVISDMFEVINMTARSLTLPILPPAGMANWIAAAAYNSKTDKARTGDELDVALTEMTLRTYKLGAKAFLPEETEEDTIITLLPLIRDHLVRSHAKALDYAILRGDAEAFTGLIGIANADTAEKVTTANGSTKVTAAMFQENRRFMGLRGLDASKLRVLVSYDAWYDLQDDPEWKDVNVVGDANAIKLRGQVGRFYGMPVIATEHFPATALDVVFGAIIDPTAFKRTQQRGLTLRTDFDVELDTTVLVATQRQGFHKIWDNGVVTLKYAAA